MIACTPTKKLLRSTRIYISKTYLYLELIHFINFLTKQFPFLTDYLYLYMHNVYFILGHYRYTHLFFFYNLLQFSILAFYCSRNTKPTFGILVGLLNTLKCATTNITLPHLWYSVLSLESFSFHILVLVL